MCGRSGQGGKPARAHIIFNPKQKCKDLARVGYCKDKENCLRQMLLKGVGGDVLTSLLAAAIAVEALFHTLS